MSNLLKAIQSIILNPITKLPTKKSGSNKINAVGDALEMYVQDVFAETHGMSDKARTEKLSDVFSYRGNSNNPPDAILKNGDAIEVKKVQSPNAVLALNSSYPKAKLFADSNMISKACRECEDWTEKDLLYVIGYTSDSKLKYLWFIYGDCFAADKDVYERIKNTISDGIDEIKGVEFTKTNELGKVKKVDPLGITDLRIRGMWHIENPHTIFEYLYKPNNSEFQLFCLMQKEKFEKFPTEDKDFFKNFNGENFSLREVKIKNPNNPVNLIDCTFITFRK